MQCLKDRRKAWQKTANIKWSRCGTQLSENAYRKASRKWSRYQVDVFIVKYAEALGCIPERYEGQSSGDYAKARKAAIQGVIERIETQRYIMQIAAIHDEANAMAIAVE